METYQLYLLSIYLKKWSYTDNRIAINYSFCYEYGYARQRIEMRIGAPANLLNEILSHLFSKAKEEIHKRELLNNPAVELNTINIQLVNDPEVKRKLTLYLTKILKEFNYNKRSRGKSRMISTRSLDFFYNDYEYEALEDHIKFYVHLNRGINKMNGDLWSNAVDDFTLALQFKPRDVTANKQIAMALQKLGEYEKAIDHLIVCAEEDRSPDSLKELASAYVHIDEFSKAENIFKQIEKEFEEPKVVTFGRAQLRFRKGKGFKQLLDRIYRDDPTWLQEKIKNEWDFKLPSHAQYEECMWNAATAARYLGFDRPFDLTKRAFNDELPSYFDSERGTIRFVKAELDAWVELMNRYKIDGEEYQIYENRLSKEELERTKLPKGRKSQTQKRESNLKPTETVI